MSVNSKLDLLSCKLFSGVRFSDLTKFQQEYVLQVYAIDNYTD